jgi:hypothetical protein
MKGLALVAFLYLKVEGPDENDADIEPGFKPNRWFEDRQGADRALVAV